jgi:hypothetical protein
MEGLRRAPHDYQPSTQIFPDLDVAKLSAELDLERRGRKRGERVDPADDAAEFDETEALIIERIEAEKKQAHALLEEQLQTAADRLAGLDFEGRFGMIQQVAPACIGDFRAEVATGRDELHALRRRLRDHEKEVEAFKRKNRLDRVARVQSGAAWALKWAVLAFLLIFEIIINGSFLAKGSEYGLYGGVTEAFGFAVLNVGAAVLFAALGVRQLNHRSKLRKLIGAVSLVSFVAFTGLLNLALAHYREVSGTLLEAGGEAVVTRLSNAPLALQDITSWIFFGIGCLFAIIAFIDALFLTDPYPGYGDAEQRLTHARRAYIDRKAELMEELQDVRNEYSEKIDQVRQDLGVRRKELDSILYTRSRLVQMFDDHQAQIERVGNALLSSYREAINRGRESAIAKSKTKQKPKAREEVQPNGPAKMYRMERIKLPLQWPDDTERAELKASIKAAQDTLNKQVSAIHAEFEEATERYHQLDDLVPEQSYGTSAAA